MCDIREWKHPGLDKRQRGMMYLPSKVKLYSMFLDIEWSMTPCLLKKIKTDLEHF